jgi:hypothetical protein
MLTANAGRMSLLTALALVAGATGLLAPLGAAQAQWQADVGYTQLQGELGALTPDGSGVVVSHVEGSVTVDGHQTWMPDPGHAEFLGKTLTDISGAPAGLYSSHATSVGQKLYGLTSSLSPAIDHISVYWASQWIGGDFLWTTGGRRPASSSSRLANHSWVGNVAPYDGEALRRLDWLIENDDVIHVAALNNGNGGASTHTLLASAFNVIAAGRSDGVHAIGSVAIDSTYTSARTRPDVVIPAGSTSSAAPRISSVAALLIQTGHADATLSTHPAVQSYTNRAGLLIRNAERAEVVKALLMAGADRVTRNTSTTNLVAYRIDSAHQSANGLDRRYGAGQVNVYNSHRMLAAGEQNSNEDGGAGAGSTERGWDYDPAFGGASGSNTTATYPLPVSSTPRVLTASLAWHLDIHGGTQNSFNGTATLRDLNLAVRDVADPASPVAIASSQSTSDNTENLYLIVPANAQYELHVTRVATSGFSHDYALAWQLLPDADGDGAHDGIDNCTAAANGPLARDAGGHSQRDTDGDGFGNLCDPDFNNNGIVDSQDGSLFRSRFGSTSYPDQDLNGNGVVDSQDGALLRNRFGQAPGPSGVSN